MKLKELFEPIDIALAIVGRHVLSSIGLPSSLLNFRNSCLINNHLNIHVSSPAYHHSKNIKLSHIINGS